MPGIEHSPTGDGVTVTVDNPEVPAEIIAAVAEAQSEQAAADVAIAETHAEAATEQTAIIAEAQTEQARIAADVATAVSREELEECRQNLAMLRTDQEANRSLMELILQRLEALEPRQNLQEPPESGGAVPPDQGEPPKEPVKKKSRVNWT